MRHAEILTDRILLLEGLPNYQCLFHVRVGAIDRLRRGIEIMRDKGDITSANLCSARPSTSPS